MFYTKSARTKYVLIMVIGNIILFCFTFWVVYLYDNPLLAIGPAIFMIILEVFLVYLLVTKPMTKFLLGLLDDFYLTLDDSKLKEELKLMEEYFYTVKNKQRRIITAIQVISIKKMLLLNAADQINVMKEYWVKFSKMKYKNFAFLNNFLEVGYYYLIRDDIEQFRVMYEEVLRFPDNVKQALLNKIQKVSANSNLNEMEELGIFYKLYTDGYDQELVDKILSTNHNNYYSALYIYLMRNYYLSNDNMNEAKRMVSYLEKYEGNAKFLMKENG